MALETYNNGDKESKEKYHLFPYPPCPRWLFHLCHQSIHHNQEKKDNTTRHHHRNNINFNINPLPLPNPHAKTTTISTPMVWGIMHHLFDGAC
jgi:hypothetical protein